MSWWGLVLACMAGAMSPGPSLVFVLGLRARDGRTAALQAALGHGLGVGLYALAAAAGLALVIQTQRALELGLSLAGALYLLWLAKSFWPQAQTTPSSAPADDLPSARSGFIAGFLVAVLNPKVVFFFAGIFAAMVPVDAGPVAVGLAAALAAGIDAFWYLLVAALGGGVAQQLGRPAWARAFAMFFAVAGVLVALRALASLV